MNRDKHKKDKKFPPFESGEAAENFVDNADLSEYDFSQFKPMRLIFCFDQAH
jgi:hypothetical protein